MSRASQRAQTEWARMQETAQGRTRVESFNDRALETLIALARWYAIGGLIGLAWLGPWAIWWWGWFGVAVTLGHALLVGLAGWWGWWQYGDKQWKPDA